MLEFLTDSLRNALANVNLNYVYELRVRANKPVVLNYGGKYTFLGKLGTTPYRESALVSCYADIETIIYRACEYSLYSVTEQLRQGFLTGAGGERIGLAGIFVYEGGESFTVKEVTSLNIRVPHEVKGCGQRIYDLCFADGVKSALLLSPPGRGKTTILRDLTRLISQKNLLNVLINDERNELSASYRDFSLDTGAFSDVIRYRRGNFRRRRLHPQWRGSARVRALQGRGRAEKLARTFRRLERQAVFLLYFSAPGRRGGDRSHLRQGDAGGVLMLKLLLCAAVVALCVAFSFLLTRRYRSRMQFYYNLSLFNERLVNEVSYTRIPLPAFLEKYSFTGDFDAMLRQKKGDFSLQNYQFSYLTEDEKKYLADYFGMIGRSDAASQRTFLSAARAELAEKKKSAEEAYKKYFALYLKLGFLAGLILVVLIV